MLWLVFFHKIRFFYLWVSFSINLPRITRQPVFQQVAQITFKTVQLKTMQNTVTVWGCIRMCIVSYCIEGQQDDQQFVNIRLICHLGNDKWWRLWRWCSIVFCELQTSKWVFTFFLWFYISDIFPKVVWSCCLCIQVCNKFAWTHVDLTRSGELFDFSLLPSINILINSVWPSMKAIFLPTLKPNSLQKNGSTSFRQCSLNSLFSYIFQSITCVVVGISMDQPEHIDRHVVYERKRPACHSAKTF